MEKRAFKHDTWFTFEDRPAYWNDREFPIRVKPGGTEEVFYDIETFAREAIPVSEEQYKQAVAALGSPGADA